MLTGCFQTDRPLTGLQRSNAAFLVPLWSVTLTNHCIGDYPFTVHIKSGEKFTVLFFSLRTPLQYHIVVLL